MVAPDPAIVERQYYLTLLGWAVDNTAYSLQDLKERYAATQQIRTLDKNIRLEVGQPLATSIQTVTGGGIVATDNGDGGVTITTTPASKIPYYAYAESTYFKLANAVLLATTAPAGESAQGTAGVGIAAARNDHAHPINAPHAYPIVAAGGSQCASPNGQLSSGVGIGVGATACPIVELPVPRPFTLTELSVSILTASVGGSGLIKMALYGSNSRGMLSGAPLYTSGAISSTTVGIKTFTGLSWAMPVPGLYHIVLGNYAWTTSRCLPNRGSANQQWGDNAGVAGVGAGTGPTPWLSNFNETTGVFPASPTVGTQNDGDSYWYTFNGDPL